MKKEWFSPARMLLMGTALATAVSYSSCKKDDNTNNMYTISGTGNSSQVVPAFTGTGTGTVTGTYNKSTNRFDYNVGWNGLTDTASTVAFYTGGSGVSGVQAMTLPVTTQGSTGNTTGYVTLTDQQETDLLAGNWYYSVGTVANTNGEIRGQISAAQ